MATTLPASRSLLGGRYLLGEPIGAGGMGIVYKATQPALRRLVAVKFLRCELAANPHVLEHFRREAAVVARISHPNLVTIYDVGESTDGTPFLVMELVPGRPLGELVREQLMPIAQAARIARQLLAALSEVHRNGVVHADVKSDNVLVDRAPDGTEKVKLIDFGLACAGRCEPHLGADGEPAVAGTPDFMAPEVIRGAPPSPAADLYGVGVVLYELLTGATPFGGGGAAEILRRHLVEPVVPPSLRRPDRGISRALDEVVLRALSKAPGDRFRDADELSRAVLAAARAASDAPGPAASAEHRFGTDLDTEVGRPPLVIATRPRITASGDRRRMIDEERRLRAAIGRSIRDGAVDTLADGYRALARHLVERGHPVAAADELREGLDLVSTGGAATCALAARRLRSALRQLRSALDARDSDDRTTLNEAVAFH